LAKEVIIPRLGNTVESCLIIEWKVNEGDQVKTGDILCEIETDKVTFEVESPHEGLLLKKFFNAGDDVPILTNIGVIGEPGEDYKEFIPKIVTEHASATQPGVQSEGSPKASFTEDSTARGISPRASSLVAKHGIDISYLSGTGPQGRILEKDVQHAINNMSPLTANTAVPQSKAAYTPPSMMGAYQEIPIKGIRKLISDKMYASLANTAQLTLNSSVDASHIIDLREKFKGLSENDPLFNVTMNDIVLFAVAKVLSENKYMNAHFTDDKIMRFEKVHLGLAVHTPKGLMVPVIRNTDSLEITQISRERIRLIDACQSGKIEPDDLNGGTFTVTNLGSMGIESFTPILNAPEVGILGVCAIQLKPVNVDGEIEFLPHMGLSLTFNHQAVDGAPAERFLKNLTDILLAFDYK